MPPACCDSYFPKKVQASRNAQQLLAMKYCCCLPLFYENFHFCHVTLSLLPSKFSLSNGRLTENVFKRIAANSNPNLNPNPKTQKSFRENDMTSFFGQMSRYPISKGKNYQV